MNTNNRNNNNRRRGRGNRPNTGGGQQLNRIDSRARGNAPQLLEKYRKLAHDAHLNGDRVQAEYYLQFADHYFRVLADQRVRQDEQRGGRRDERWEGGEGPREDGDDTGDYAPESDFPSFDQPQVYPRREREERGEWQRRDREERDESDERPASEAEAAEEAQEAEPSIYEPPANPFVRGERSTRGLRPRRESRAPREDRDADNDAPVGLDPSTLPPPISASRDADVEEAEAKPRRGRPRKVRPADDAGETLESVN